MKYALADRGPATRASAQPSVVYCRVSSPDKVVKENGARGRKRRLRVAELCAFLREYREKALDQDAAEFRAEMSKEDSWSTN